MSGSVTTWGAVTDDSSANAAAVPIAGFVLLITVPISKYRVCVEIQNQSAGTVQVVRDDGLGTTGTVSSILLAGGGANAQGGGWSSTTFKGRVRVYGASGAQVSAFQE